jgi:hypothetical protein
MVPEECPKILGHLGDEVAVEAHYLPALFNLQNLPGTKPVPRKV